MVRLTSFVLVLWNRIVVINIIIKVVDSVFSALYPLKSQYKFESTAFLGTLWVLNAQAIPHRRKLLTWAILF